MNSNKAQYKQAHRHARLVHTFMSRVEFIKDARHMGINPGIAYDASIYINFAK